MGKGGLGGKDRDIGDKLPGDPCTKTNKGEAGEMAWDNLVKGSQEAEGDDESPQ